MVRGGSLLLSSNVLGLLVDLHLNGSAFRTEEINPILLADIVLQRFSSVEPVKESEDV